MLNVLQNSPRQNSFDFDAPFGLDEQLDEALDSLGVGSKDWNEALEGRFLFWLHIHVLQDTVYQISDTRVGRKMKVEAAEWLFSEMKTPFSFHSVSRVLGTDPGEMLAKLIEMPEVKRGLLSIGH